MMTSLSDDDCLLDRFKKQDEGNKKEEEKVTAVSCQLCVGRWCLRRPFLHKTLELFIFYFLFLESNDTDNLQRQGN